MSAHDRDRTSPADDKHVVRRVDEVTGALEQLTGVLDQEEELHVVLQRLCHQVVPAIPGADLASVAVVEEGGPRTVAATSDQAIDIDQAQYDADAGPALDAARTGHVVRVTVSADAVARWPQFADAAGTASVRSYLSAPLYIDKEFSGSLNLYGVDDHGFSELDAALLELYTTAAEAALRQAQRHRSARATTEQLRTALSSRAVIDQAKGILMAARHITADEAFTLLVKKSQHDNVKLSAVAEKVLEQATRPRQ
ncbi:GAF and ANTAR domain-containing protein [Amycolatopsis sp. NBC_01488]|uniref:ANTAR domain-containing response regulator n=1 Tax=Amycolatopsis sp. NBC_01488 TaxID=2903563 RepID=UPI002E2A3277|nr:GAF and ANTAR domain-containing protein [Amycolatopsis sp. NBC_01488]